MAVARVTQVIGASPHSWEDAVRNALERANRTLRNITGIEVLKENAAIEDALGDFSRLRQSNLRLLTRTTPDERKRVIHHAERGDEPLAHLIKLYAGHDLVHRRQVARIRARVAG